MLVPHQNGESLVHLALNSRNGAALELILNHPSSRVENRTDGKNRDRTAVENRDRPAEENRNRAGGENRDRTAGENSDSLESGASLHNLALNCGATAVRLLLAAGLKPR